MKKRSVIAVSGHKFRTRNISRRVRNIVISPIKEMSILADSVQKKTKEEIISFGQGIPFFDTPDSIKAAVRKALDEKSTAKYTLEPGMTELRQLIGKHLSRTKNIKNIIPEKEIMVSMGCQEAMDCAIATTIDPGDEAILLSPCYASHMEQVIQWSGKPVFVRLDEKNGWRLDGSDLEKKITKKTKAIIFSNPSNPTGKVFKKHEIEMLAASVKKHDLVLITDETYDFLAYGEKFLSPASFAAIRDRVILCGSFSKRYAMTGYRVGYAFADSGILDHMLKVHDALAICAPAISQKAAIAGLKESSDSAGYFREKLAENREFMCKKLDELKTIFDYQKPEGAYYILARYKLPKINSFELAIKILNEAHVVTIPGDAFGPGGERHLRFSFACSKGEIETGFERLGKWVKGLKL